MYDSHPEDAEKFDRMGIPVAFGLLLIVVGKIIIKLL